MRGKIGDQHCDLKVNMAQLKEQNQQINNTRLDDMSQSMENTEVARQKDSYILAMLATHFKLGSLNMNNNG